MKFLFVLSLMIGSFHSLARVPQAICEKPSFKCSKKQIEIEQKFFLGKSIDPNVIGESVFSGSCYHQAHHTNPNHEHWGVMFFDWKNHNAYFGGKFGFFHPKNPYRDMTPSEARISFRATEKPEQILQWTKNYNFAHINQNSEHLWIYWFSQNHETQKIYIKAYWSVFHFLYCELSPNSNVIL